MINLALVYVGLVYVHIFPLFPFVLLRGGLAVELGPGRFCNKGARDERRAKKI